MQEDLVDPAIDGNVAILDARCSRVGGTPLSVFWLSRHLDAPSRQNSKDME